MGQLGLINPFFTLRLRLRRELLRPTGQDEQIISSVLEATRNLSKDGMLILEAELEARHFVEDNLMRAREARLLSSVTNRTDTNLSAALGFVNDLLDHSTQSTWQNLSNTGWDGHTITTATSVGSNLTWLLRRLHDTLYNLAGGTPPDRQWAGNAQRVY